MNTAPLLQEADNWREEADEIEEWKGENAAVAVRRAAERLETVVRTWENESLPIDIASDESGYSEDHLRSLVGDRIPNAGQKGDPRIRRKHLPQKPGHLSPSSSSDKPSGSRSQVACSVLSSD